MSSYRIVRHTYKLDTATTAKAVSVFGNYIQVVAASSLAAEIGVEMLGTDLKTDGVLNLRKDDFIRVPDPFTRVDLTWEAQPGAWVQIVFITQDPAPEEFEYVRQQRGVIDSIASTVNVAPDGGNNFDSSIVSVGSGTSVKLANANPNRRCLVVTIPRTFGGTFHLGKDASVASATHGFIEGGSSYDTNYKGEVWGKTSAGTIGVSVMEDKV